MAEPATAVRRRGRRRRPVSLAVFGLIAAACVLAPVVDPNRPTTPDPANAFAPASAAHWLGTDELGRDMLARLLYGGRLSLGVAAGAVVIALVLGTAWGLLAASTRGLADQLLMRTADVAMAVPQILFALVCVAAFGASLPSLIIIAGLLLAPTSARMARAAVIQEMTLDYYLAAVASGTGRVRLLLSELLPNVAPALGSQAVINAASAIILEASLSFVGLGVQPPQMSWGGLLQQGYAFLFSDPSYALGPAAFILLTVLCLNLAADRLGGAGLLGPRSAR
ncbi:ABC transporter permease [Dactylosporangium sp. NPDC051541]|uniref:ABC transporter permease n=1 Tax=Dactylosporangium sp. NPDC051541 TaxID=3363977 RepID=UPI0037B33D8D